MDGFSLLLVRTTGATLYHLKDATLMQSFLSGLTHQRLALNVNSAHSPIFKNSLCILLSIF